MLFTNVIGIRLWSICQSVTLSLSSMLNLTAVLDQLLIVDILILASWYAIGVEGYPIWYINVGF